MRKFKHIKTGAIAEYFNEHFYKVSSFDNAVPKKFIEDTDDWQEIKEYPKIISFRRTKDSGYGGFKKGYLWCVQEDGMFLAEGTLHNKIGQGYFLSDPEHEIYQVRTSDTEVFTVGDKVCWNWKQDYPNFYTIKTFNLVDDDLKIKYEELTTPHPIYSSLKHYKTPTPLFVTEDGKEKFYKDTYYYVVEHDRDIIPNAWKVICGVVNWENPKKPPLGKVQFDSIAKAEVYIEQNKPRFSVKDVEEALKDSSLNNIHTSIGECFIINQFKQKLGI